VKKERLASAVEAVANGLDSIIDPSFNAFLTMVNASGLAINIAQRDFSALTPIFAIATIAGTKRMTRDVQNWWTRS
jgi:hypothetical protein